MRCHSPSFVNLHLQLLILVLLRSCYSGIASNTPSSSWVLQCRQQGFDPWQLACGTCELLQQTFSSPESEKSIYKQCLQCCQSYKDTAHIRKPYEAAVLMIQGSRRRQRPADSASDKEGEDDPIIQSLSNELKDFLREDWKTLVETKGTRRLEKKIVERKDGPESYTDLYSLMSMGGVMGGSTVSILFYDSAMPKGHDTLDDYQKMAKEVVTLDSRWKRDDVKDMISTLLP